MNLGPILTPWSANAAAGATLHVVGASVDAGYNLSALVDGDPANGVVLDGPAAILLCDFGAAVHIAHAALIHHNADLGVSVAWRGYSSLPTTVADVPGLDVPVTPRAIEGTGYRPNLWANIDAVDPAASYRYQGWLIGAIGSPALDISAGEIVCDTTRRQLATDFLVGATASDAFETIRNRTYGGVVLKARKVNNVRQFEGQFLGPLAEVAALRDHFLALAGSAENFLLVPDPDGEDAYLVEWLADTLTITYVTSVSGDIYRLSCGFRELTRGLVWV
jgi:hypothetical protein